MAHISHLEFSVIPWTTASFNMKKIQVNFTKCSGCRSCEVICSLQHYRQIQPRRARIRVIRNPETGESIPIIAGVGTAGISSCTNRPLIIIEGKEYDSCLLCRANCPTRPHLFTEPDSNMPIQCDLCGDDPSCVKWCQTGALTFIES